MTLPGGCPYGPYRSCSNLHPGVLVIYLQLDSLCSLALDVPATLLYENIQTSKQESLTPNQIENSLYLAYNAYSPLPLPNPGEV